MYKGLNVVQKAIEQAELSGSKISNDRKKYEKFYDVLESYISENNVIVVGKLGTKLLLYQPLDLLDYQYEIISKTPEYDAKSIAKLFYGIDPKNISKYTYVSTKIKNKRYEIVVDNRQLVVINSLDTLKGVNGFDLIIPAERPGYFAKDSEGSCVNLKVFDNELQLINIYSSIIDPLNASDYVELMEFEAKLRDIFLEETGYKIKDFIKKYKGGNESKHCNLSHKTIVQMLLEKFVFRTGHVLIGQYAIDVLRYNIQPDSIKYDKSFRLQIISSNDIKEDKKRVIDMVKDLGCTCYGVINNPNVPTDSNMRRLTFYIDRKDGKREILMDIFNVCRYQLIPHINKIGTVFTIMKFTLVDIWTIQFLFRLNPASKKFTIQLIDQLINNYKLSASILRKQLEKANNNKDFHLIFPTQPSDFIGCYIDELTAHRRKMYMTKTGQIGNYYLCDS